MYICIYVYMYICICTYTYIDIKYFICLLQTVVQINIQAINIDTTATTCSTLGGFDPEPEPQTLPGQANVLAVSDPGAGGWLKLWDTLGMELKGPEIHQTKHIMSDNSWKTKWWVRMDYVFVCFKGIMEAQKIRHFRNHHSWSWLINNPQTIIIPTLG